jgi:hypothetical protein
MGTFVFILVLAAIVGAVVWNHRNKSAAADGVEFAVPEPPQAVAAAIASLYCQGARAVVKKAFSRISVTQVSAGGFVFGTKLGDEGQIEVHPGQGGGSIVRASTSTLYIGSSYRPRFGTTLMIIAAAITNMLFLMLRLAPFAARMKRFQCGLEHRIARQVGRQVGN